MTVYLEKTRAKLAEQGLDAFLCPVSNRFLTKFLLDSENLVALVTGAAPRISYGTVVVTKTKAALFTAPLYEEMVRAEVNQQQFELFTNGTEDVFEWLAKNTITNAYFDPWFYSLKDREELTKKAAAQGVALLPTQNIIAYAEKADDKTISVEQQAGEYAGKTPETTFTQHLLPALKAAHIQHYLLAHGPSLSWLLNLRVPSDSRNPVLRAYALVDVAAEKLTLFCDHDLTGKLPAFVVQKPLADAEKIDTALPLALDPHLTPAAFAPLNYQAFIDPCLWLKAKKNLTEQDGIRETHMHDAAALCRTLAWIDRTQNITEWDVAQKLTAERAKDNLFRGISFEPIVGFNANGASIHHATRADNAQTLSGNGLLLLDSGGQYDNGTTDVTRTVAIGTPSVEMKHAFTHVLKSHIALARSVFPVGATGAQLDGMARAPMWQAGLDYRHGTGHGVGYWLNVHEGPYNISGKCVEGAVAGLLLSIEPGYYLSGQFGIRLENLALTQPAHEGYLRFETVTLAPFDTRCLVPELLNADERTWLNTYHATVRQEITPLLNDSDAEWLFNATKDI